MHMHAHARRGPVPVHFGGWASFAMFAAPSRAPTAPGVLQVSDIAIAVREGADAVMLSGETAFGKFPFKAVEVMGTVSKRTESSMLSYSVRALRPAAQPICGDPGSAEAGPRRHNDHGGLHVARRVALPNASVLQPSTAGCRVDEHSAMELMMGFMCLMGFMGLMQIGRLAAASHAPSGNPCIFSGAEDAVRTRPLATQMLGSS